MTSLRDWLGFRRRESAGDTVLLIAREVTDRQRSVQGGLAEIRDPAVLDRLSAEDFEGLDLVIEEQADEDREYAVVLARLTYAAARAKGFDDQIVDAALRLDTLLARRRSQSRTGAAAAGRLRGRAACRIRRRRPRRTQPARSARARRG